MGTLGTQARYPGLCEGTFSGTSIALEGISGTLPAAFASLTSLTSLTVSNGALSGTLPPSFASLTRLQKLALDNNRVSGTLPSAYATLSQLRNLSAYRNALSGTLPTSYAHLTQLPTLIVDHNSLSGTLPAAYANIDQLQHLLAFANALSGTLPIAYANLGLLQHLEVGKNAQLSGTLPLEYSSLTQLRYLDIVNNSLSGTLPAAYGNLTRLELLDVSSNGLSGTLPTALGSLSNLTVLIAGHNFFEYPATPTERHAYNIATQQCTTFGYVCQGVPPLSCSAFADDAVPSLLNPGTCVTCANPSDGLALLITLVLLVLGALALIVRARIRKPDALRRWTATAFIIGFQQQSLVIIGLLDLGWPPSVQFLINGLLSLNIFNLELLSCLLSTHDMTVSSALADVQEATTAFQLTSTDIYNTTALALQLAFLTALLVARAVAERRGVRAFGDQLTLLLSLAFSLSLTFSWTILANVISKSASILRYAHVVSRAIDTLQSNYIISSTTSGADYLHGAYSVVATQLALAALLLLLQMCICVDLASRISSFKRGVTLGVWHQPRGFSWRGWRGWRPKPILPRRLAKQVALLTGRFADHGMHWQMVVWLRQFALFVIVLVAQLFRRGAHGNELGVTASFAAARYTFASAALAVVLVAWRVQRSSQPYLYRFQNALEEWLFASNALILLLSVGYAALPAEHTAMRTLIEVAMMFILIGGILSGAVYAAAQLRKTGRALDSVNLGDGLVHDAKIDAPLRDALANGDIRLVRCSWLVSAEASDVFGGATPSSVISHQSDAFGGAAPSGISIAKRMQELPPDAFFSPTEAAQLLDRGDRSILSLSYRWVTGLHPDPKGASLSALRSHLLRDARTLGCGLFWDFVSLPQKGRDGERTEAEALVFARALAVITRLYASVTGTTVLILKDVPSRPAEFDGRITLFAREGGGGAGLRAELEHFGEVIELDSGGTDVHVTFATHAQAEAAVAALPMAATAYNSASYDRDGGSPYSGWCTFEQGVAKMVAAHLAATSRQAAGLLLPPRLTRAEASRPKVIDISGGTSAPVTKMEHSAEDLLNSTMEAIEHATFVWGGDRPLVLQLLGELEWDIKATAVQAMALIAMSGLTIDPELLRQIRYNAHTKPSQRLLAPSSKGDATASTDVELVASESVVASRGV